MTAAAVEYVMSFARWVIVMREPIKALLQGIYHATKGDPKMSAAALRQIANYGLKLDAEEAIVDARIQAVRERDKS